MQVAVPTRTRNLPECVEDAYVRGPDMIVTYAETTQSPVRPQVCWRILDQSSASPGIVVEAIVSMQTRWPDSDPRIQITSVIPGREWFLSDRHRRPTGDLQPIALDGSLTTICWTFAAGYVALLARIPASACSLRTC